MTKEPDGRCPGCGMRSMTSVEWATKVKRVAALEAQLEQFKHVEAQRDYWRKENLDSMDKATHWEEEHTYALIKIKQLEEKIGQLKEGQK